MFGSVIKLINEFILKENFVNRSADSIIKSITIPDSVVYIGDLAFEEFTNILIYA